MAPDRQRNREPARHAGALALLALATAATAGFAGEVEPELFIESIYFNPDPPTIEEPRTGLLPQLFGPFPLEGRPEQVATLDVAGSPREEFVFLSEGRIFWADLEPGSGATGTLPALPEPPLAWAALDFVGTPRVDLLAATAEGLLALDLDAKAPAWSAPIGLPFAPRSLTAAEVAGDGGLDLVALAGDAVYAASRSPSPPLWQALAAPPVSLEMLAGTDVGIGPPSQTPSSSLRVLVGYAGERRLLYDPEARRWEELDGLRFPLRGAAPFDLRHPAPPAVGGLLVAEPAAATVPHFANVSAELGLDAPLDPGGDGHCPGAVFTDLTGDDLPDLYLVRGRGGLGPENLLYQGDGAGGVTPVHGAAGADDPGNGAGALALDFDNDGDRDLYIVNYDEPNRLLRNDDGVFVDVTDATDPTPLDPPGDLQEGLAFGMSTQGCEPGEALPCRLDDSLSAGAGDFDRDGDLDLYVGNHLCCTYLDGERDILYRNEGDGRFTDITLDAGIARPGDANPSNQALLVADLDGDGWPDLYLANKGNGPSRDQLFLNRGDADGDGVWDGVFVDWMRTQLPPIGGVTGAAMGIAPGDYDGDGDLDLFLTDIGEMDLLRNRLADDGVFSLEVVEPNPVASPDFAWGTSWADFDNDGDLDLHVATATGGMDWLQRNEGEGGFREVTYSAGLAQAWASRASLPADYDRDGWLDLLVVQRGDRPVSLFHNRSARHSDAHWLQIAVAGSPELTGRWRSTRDAAGARVWVTSEAGRQRRDVVLGAHSCASSSDALLHFGLGDAAQVAEVRVDWPSGRTTRLFDVAADQRLEIVEAPEPGALAMALGALVSLAALRAFSARRRPS